ncbi:MAG: hypothetical protein IJK00_08425 [Clostridia bacterium]|nr:hypothetical protein [Clostridia bacterium]
MKKCPICHTSVEDSVQICPSCLFDFSVNQNILQAEEKEETNVSIPVTDNEASDDKKDIISVGNLKIKKKYFYVGIGVLAIMILLLGIVLVNGGILTGNDKIAYDLIMNVAPKFKNPASIRLVSGVAGTDKDDGEKYMFCGISAKNGLGVRSTEYYYINDKGTILEEEPDYSFYFDTDKLNIEKINKILERKLKKYD